MTPTSYAIAAGHDVALGSLTNLNGVTPSGDFQAFADPKAIPLYNPGEIKITLDGQVYVSGYAAAPWQFGILTFRQHTYLSTTFCASGYSGEVTIYTTLGGIAFYRMNATLILPKPSELRAEMSWYTNAVVLMSRLGTAA